MIKLTLIKGDAYYVNPDIIAGVLGEEEYARVDLQDRNFAMVTESPEEVVRKIMEYKMAMVRYAAASNAAVAHADPVASSDYAEGDMKRLAGLEESPDAQ